MGMIDVAGLKVDSGLHDFIVSEALPGTGLDAMAFWGGFATLVKDLAPTNKALLERRDALQAAIDDWHRKHPGPVDQIAYEAFLTEIGYLQPPPRAVPRLYRQCG